MRGEVQLRPDRLAVLIDADNASADIIEPLLKEVAKYGNAHVKRIYGDWTSTQNGKWKDRLVEFAIQPMQQFAYTKGKNSTDSAMIIDAMDLLYSQKFDGFCIVSSDSDFTRLAGRLRESGLVIYGFGERKTPKSFIGACDKFIYTEILKEPEESNTGAGIQASPAKTPLTSQSENPAPKLSGNEQLIKLLKDAYEATAHEELWVELGLFGNLLTQLSPDFDSRNYGFKQLKKLVKAVDIFEMREIPHERNPANKVAQIKLKS